MDETNVEIEEERVIRTFLDEDGNKVQFEAIAEIYLEKQGYLLLAPMNDEESEDVFVFRMDEIDGKEELNIVEDDKEFIAVKKEYKKLLY
ncbi:DUF1292 domain-containing protein [Clostridium gasigenes]|uniref:Uncharacterized protein n=1 Tax=Clostridium gasigenes TaxID=94869 RepID=A0A1H0M967_9CLOT|nr:DUF1292 domain-containing protein [Clostridium gasigenes]MBB6622220.1 DUF1292 domain-containing protein [Clostridium gasigenes]MBU3087042.1 DUF1292 domain-containing protein [Clostridium gasigenes]MBU3106254.1 DUF1292 domain-containing protein [Clostridium gasigenes]MBU3131140.1 DUF1292 domain-containing protein [Clostridium gasigenes]MBU3134661.1 DUF1292 domain-containing protein [Clostridium gasigenes]